MGQLAKNICEMFYLLYLIYIFLSPKFNELFMYRFKDRTLVCCKIQGKYVNRGERLIKLSYSWFFAKVVLAIH